jgi:aryl-alcohol dehydrogenase-like predicted oxidoreductase
MIDRLPFGSTGHSSSRLIFGAAALGGVRKDKADQVMAQVHEAGINHLDTAASYGDSELRLAPFLADHRSDVFLATKTGERVGTSAREELERSLIRMGVDSVDLIQLHNLVEEDEWAQAFRPDGVVSALTKARDEGLVRYIGVTGHGTRIPSMHIRSLNEFAFDSVLFPLNHALLTIDQYRNDVEALMALCRERNVAMQTIKSVARSRWTADAGPRYSWYEPIADEAAQQRAVRFVLSHADVFLNTSSDIRLLANIIATAIASDNSARPSEDALESDRQTHAISPLFDGLELERI